MYISDCEFIHEVGYGYKPNINAKISINDCSGSDLETIKRLVNIKRSIYICDRESFTTTIGFGKMESIPKCTDIKVKKVIFSNPATIVFWSDGTKTVVKCGKDDTYDKEKGFYIACAKKLFGNDYKAVGRMNKALTMAEVKETEDEQAHSQEKDDTET